jgi:hypothetical protein
VPADQINNEEILEADIAERRVSPEATTSDLSAGVYQYYNEKLNL